jgi:hypothetical protein
MADNYYQKYMKYKGKYLQARKGATGKFEAAINSEDIQKIKVLLLQGQIRSKTLLKAYAIADKKNNREIASLLAIPLYEKAIIHNEDRVAKWLEQKHLDQIGEFFKDKISVLKYYMRFQPLFVEACKKGNLNVVKMLANENYEHEMSMRTGFYEAVLNYHLEVVKHLAPMLNRIIIKLKKDRISAPPLFRKENRELFFGSEQLKNNQRKQILDYLLESHNPDNQTLLFTKDEYVYLNELAEASGF